MVGTDVQPYGHDVYRWSATTSSWSEIPGEATAVAGAPHDNPWMINSLQQIWTSPAGVGGPRQTPPTVTPAENPPPAGSFVVTSYGADPSGQHNSTAAIQDAIRAAEAAAGWQTVYFPPGTYLLDDNNGATADFNLEDVTVNILGSGASFTKLVEKVGTYAYPRMTRGKDVFVFSKMANFYIDGMTIDSQTYNAGDTIDDTGDNSTIQDVAALGAHNGSGKPVDTANVFDLRVIAVCNADPANPHYELYHFGNVINDVVLNGRGSGGNDDLDISCQQDDTISNIVDTGWGMALYIDQDITVDNYDFTPGGGEPELPRLVRHRVQRHHHRRVYHDGRRRPDRQPLPSLVGDHCRERAHGDTRVLAADWRLRRGHHRGQLSSTR